MSVKIEKVDVSEEERAAAKEVETGLEKLLGENIPYFLMWGGKNRLDGEGKLKLISNMDAVERGICISLALRSDPAMYAMYIAYMSQQVAETPEGREMLKKFIEDNVGKRRSGGVNDAN